MQKTVKIGEQEVAFRATAATALRFQSVFKQELLDVVFNKENTNAASVKSCQRLAYIMAASAEKRDMSSLSPENFEDWLDQFDNMEFLEALPEIISIYGGSKISVVDRKKK